MRLAPDDPRLAYWSPLPVDRARAEVRLERFAKASVEPLGYQVGPLANVRSSSGCAVVLRSDSPWVELELARLRHHQPLPVGVDLEVVGDDGAVAVSASPDLREREGAVTLRLATGLERGGSAATLWLWLPLISTAAVAGVAVAEGAVVVAPELPAPRWLALGDSLTQGFSVQQPTQCWVHRVGRRLGLPVWNLGVGGLRIEPELFAAAIAARPWELVTVGLGSNHAWREADLDAVEPRARALLAAIDAADCARVAWLLPPWKPMEGGAGPREFMGVALDAAAAARVARVRDALRAALAGHPRVVVIEDPMPHDHRLYPDGLHPGAYASAACAAAVVDALA